LPRSRFTTKKLKKRNENVDENIISRFTNEKCDKTFSIVISDRNGNEIEKKIHLKFFTCQITDKNTNKKIYL
jgi:hypothetical protein